MEGNSIPPRYSGGDPRESALYAIVKCTTAQEMSSFCVPLALPVSADVSSNRDRPLSKPDYTGRASATRRGHCRVRTPASSSRG